MHNLEPINLKDASLLRTQAFIAGEWQGAADGSTFEVRNPATGNLLGTVPNMGATETRHAIDAANRAWSAWRKQTAKQRSAVLRKWHDLMLDNADDLALILTTEQGKPLAEAKGEIQYAASFLEWFAEEAKRVYGDTIPSPSADKRIVVVKEPVGVCAAITPWNFPAAMITRKVGPALAAGCPIIVKPAEATPLTALALAVLAKRAGVPAGVFSVVTGDPKAIGAELTGNATVRKLSFTGSTPVGRLLMAQCAPTVKKVSLELGGNAPFIVFDDADLDAAVAGAIASKYRNSGQTCVCTNRFYVHEKVYDAFAEKLRAAVGALKVGRGTEAGVTQGPLINEAAVLKVEAHIEDALAKGAKVVAGGKRHALGHGFFEPTVLSGVTPAMKVAKEETFGPLAPLFKFASDDEVVHLANDTEFGLAAYFYSRDISRVWRVAEALEYGMVGINTGLISNEVAPFGGVKQSGLGREGSHYGIDDYVVIKYLCMGEV
ncbi:NAD-dependent succinate-semialdehyde dehydrogenase [Trinickia violacea]|uniref:NAD-dependent succinate-semialdehyde dehydrogenase n=1 Tax=Trinickia violacea TaxID=2571746 RepID=A0A4P8J5C3_9BURK|nr:NAD-dependent succinate-semialdehyde dehydrogenase [Trinickia violacea]QCP54019.1 NAD-dependent succinate-semialdehyde dehydrogenase [Trinickia violacea]